MGNTYYKTSKVSQFYSYLRGQHIVILQNKLFQNFWSSEIFLSTSQYKNLKELLNSKHFSIHFSNYLSFFIVKTRNKELSYCESCTRSLWLKSCINFASVIYICNKAIKRVKLLTESTLTILLGLQGKTEPGIYFINSS